MNKGIFILVFSCCGFLLQAQLSVRQLPSQPNSSKPAGRTNAAPAQLPFWDDFSVSNNSVDSLRVWGADTFLQWDPVLSNGVFVNATLAINPPTYNVATFDGLDENGGFYALGENAIGLTDELVSYPMNLFGFSDIYLSFYWQAGGNVEIPEPGDSIRLQVLDTAGIFQTIWSKDGGDLDTTLFITQFTQEIRPLGERFISDSVRFRFQAFGDQDGPFDNWHLDWVYLDGNRSDQDQVTGYRDGAVSGQLTSPFFPFQAIPIEQFDNSMVRNQRIGTSYLNQRIGANELFAVEINYELVNANSNTQIVQDQNRAYPLLSASIGRLDTIVSIMQSDINQILLSDQDFSSILAFDSVVLSAEASVVANPPDFLNNSFIDLRVNDTVRENYTIQDYYAFDDGTAEYAAGTNIRNGQVAVQFWVRQPDTLTHIDINFPNIAPDQDGSSIDLKVYEELSDTGLKRTQQVVVENNASRNSFTRYELQTAVLISDTFYIGYQQFVSDFLAVGFDRSNDVASQYIFENKDGTWLQNVSLQGALMIRPVFKEGAESVLGVANSIEPSFTVYPNPTNGLITIEGAYDHLEVWNLSGQLVARQKRRPSHDFSALRKGLYLLRIFNGDRFESKKIVIR